MLQVVSGLYNERGGSGTFLQFIGLQPVGSSAGLVAQRLAGVCPVAVCQRILWVEFDCLAVICGGALIILPVIIDNPAVVVERRCLLGIDFDRLIVIGDRLLIITLVIVGKAAAVIRPG